MTVRRAVMYCTSTIILHLAAVLNAMRQEAELMVPFPGDLQGRSGALCKRHIWLLSATYHTWIERLKVSEVTDTGVRELGSRPNLASIVVLVMYAFYRTPPPIRLYGVCIHHT